LIFIDSPLNRQH